MSMSKAALSIMNWIDRLLAWAELTPAFNWYRNPKSRAIGWMLIAAAALILLYLLLYAFLRFAPGDFQASFFLRLFRSLTTQMLCLAPLWILFIPLVLNLVMNITRNLALRRVHKTLEFLVATEVPMGENELRPYENQFEGSGRTRNWDLRCYSGDMHEKKFSAHYALRLAYQYLSLAEQMRLNGEVSAAKELTSMALKSLPNHPLALFIQGKIAFDEKNYTGAIESFNTQPVPLPQLEQFLSNSRTHCAMSSSPGRER